MPTPPPKIHSTYICINKQGAMGFVFSDFGPHFTVRDVTGENPVTRIITHISNDEAGTVTLLVRDGWMHA